MLSAISIMNSGSVLFDNIDPGHRVTLCYGVVFIHGTDRSHIIKKVFIRDQEHNQVTEKQNTEICSASNLLHV